MNLATNTVKIHRYYEDEAIDCIRSWRKNGGWLKDIPMYCICCTKNKISQETKSKLKYLNVFYIEYEDPQIQNYSSGFLTLPFCGMLFERKIKIQQDILIRTDLDMKLLKPMPKELFNCKMPIIGQYDKISIKDQRQTFSDFLPFDTGFMITNKNDNFYSLWYELCYKQYVLDTKDWNITKAKFGMYYLEEFIVDFIHKRKLVDITPIQRYQIGEGYASIDTYSENEIKNIMFFHQHLYKNKKMMISSEGNMFKEMLNYMKRTKKII